MRPQIEPIANGEVRIVVEGKKPDWHNLVLTKSMQILVLQIIVPNGPELVMSTRATEISICDA